MGRCWVLSIALMLVIGVVSPGWCNNDKSSPIPKPKQIRIKKTVSVSSSSRSQSSSRSSSHKNNSDTNLKNIITTKYGDLKESGSHLLFNHYDPFRHIPPPGPSPLAPFPQYDPAVPAFQPMPPPAYRANFHPSYRSGGEIMKENWSKNIKSTQNGDEDGISQKRKANKTSRTIKIEDNGKSIDMKEEMDKNMMSKDDIKRLEIVKRLKEILKFNFMEKPDSTFRGQFIVNMKKELMKIKADVGDMDKNLSIIESNKEMMRLQNSTKDNKSHINTKKSKIVPKPSPTIKPKGINYNLFPHPLSNNNDTKLKINNMTVTIGGPNFSKLSNDEDEIMQKMVLMVKVTPKDQYVSSTTSSPIIVTHSGSDFSSSPSTAPVSRITTRSPTLKKKSGKSFDTTNYLLSKKNFHHHDPLYSMHGPPYDHYRVPKHSLGSFQHPPPPPTDLPLHQFNQHFDQFNHLGPSLSGHADPYYHPYFHGSPEYPSDLLPYFSEEPFTPLPPPLPTLAPYVPTPLPPTLFTPLPPYFSEEQFTPLPPPLPTLPPSLPPPPSPPPHPPPYKKSYEPYFEPYDNVPEKPRYKLSKKIRPLTKPYRKYFEKRKKLGKKYKPRKHHAPSHYNKATEGHAGLDYPAYSRIPYTSFSCKDGYPAGIYADVDAGCQVWHICEPDGRHHSFLCPNGTIFNQQLLTCDWWYNVHCEDTHNFMDKGPSLEVFRPSHNEIKPNRHKPFGFKKSSKSIIKISTLPPRVLQPTPTTPSSLHFPPPHHPFPPFHHPLSGPPVRSHFLKDSNFSPKRNGPPVHPHFLTSPTVSPGGPIPWPRPHFIEFEPYHQDSYPMYHLNTRNGLLAKRHISKKKKKNSKKLS